jgi:hypothetical protein
MPKDIFLTLPEAAEVLRLKTIATVIKWADEGRIRIVGEKRSLLVVAASIEEYAKGESQWHRERKRHAASLEPAVSATSRGANTRMKPRSLSDTENIDTIVLRRDRKLRRI